LSYPQIAELFSGSIHPTPSDESIDEKGATPSHQFNNVECDRGLSLVIFSSETQETYFLTNITISFVVLEVFSNFAK